MSLPETPSLFARIQRVTGKAVLRTAVLKGGYTPAWRRVVHLADGSSVFVKAATNELTADWLRKERRIYETLSGEFMARYIGWDEEGEFPLLVLEDLSSAHWPPPWHASQIQQVRDALCAVWKASLPDIPRLSDRDDLLDGWQQVAANPESFLSLGLASENWLAASLPTLCAVDGKQIAEGDSLLHMDIRSDNLCLHENRAVLVDWNFVSAGNADYDLGFWLPSLEAEGGPPPETLLPDSGEIAALVSGFFAARAGRPLIPDAPNVRHIQQVQLKTALPWVVRSLQLPPLDGSIAGY